MSDFKPGVQITEEGVEIFAGDTRVQLMDHGYISLDGERGLMYAQLVMLQALVERQSAIASALAQLAQAVNLSRTNSQQSVDAAMDAAFSRALGQLAKMGIRLPGMQPSQG